MLFDAENLRSRGRATGIHLALSIVVAALAAGLVFALWYPMPFREISGGRDLFLIVVAVDVVVGPLITFAVFDRRKPRKELTRDLTVVALLQLAALIYGLHTVAQARPVVLALEGDRLRVVRAIDLAAADFADAPKGLQSLSWTGLLTVATRPPTAEEKFDTIARGLAGEDVGMRPAFWLPTAQAAAAFARAAQPLDALARRQSGRKTDLDLAVQRTGRSADQLGFLPILARRTD